jgi:hypothetical protein
LGVVIVSRLALMPTPVERGCDQSGVASIGFVAYADWLRSLRRSGDMPLNAA